MKLAGSQVLLHKRLQINPEGLLYEEAQDIIEELRIMNRIFQEQRQVVKDFARHLGLFVNGHNGGQEAKLHHQETTYPGTDPHRSQQNNITPQNDENDLSQDAKNHAEVLLELIESRQAETQDLEGSIVRTSERVCSHLFTLNISQGLTS